MPRDLSDVLDYFLSEPADSGDPARGPETDVRPPALPIAALPIGDQDVVRAAFAWNLAVEVARSGGDATLLAPREQSASLLWPGSGRGPVGAAMAFTEATSLSGLHRAALDLAVARAADCNDGGVILVSTPVQWLGEAREAHGLLRWALLFTTPEPAARMASYGIAKRVLAANPEARVGITVHGAQRITEARETFEHLSDVAIRHLGRRLTSYGLLVDDLHVYRAIVNRRPIGLEHPQSRAARALRDVATLLLDDARKLTLG